MNTECLESKCDWNGRGYKEESLGTTAMGIMQFLTSLPGKEKCHPSIATIARAVNVSERTIQRHMRELEQLGYIERKERFWKGEQLTNEYTFCLGAAQKKRRRKGKRGKGKIQKVSYIKSAYAYGLSRNERVVLIYFVHKANRQGKAWKKESEVCRAVKLGKRKVRQVIEQLIEKGFLSGGKKLGVYCVYLQPEASWSKQTCVAQLYNKGEGAAEEIMMKEVDLDKIEFIYKNQKWTAATQSGGGNLFRWLKNAISKLKKRFYFLFVCPFCHPVINNNKVKGKVGSK